MAALPTHSLQERHQPWRSPHPCILQQRQQRRRKQHKPNHRVIHLARPRHETCNFTSVTVRTQHTHHSRFARQHSDSAGRRQLDGLRPSTADSEYDSAGQFLYSAQFGPLTGNRPVSSYRAYKYEWISMPASKPAIIANASSSGGDSWGHGPSHKPQGGATVWVSWNGATEVVAWRILGGTEQSSLDIVGGARRNGFETEIRIREGWIQGSPGGYGGHISQPNQLTYVQAQALDSSGQVLGTSNIVRVSS